MSRFIGALFVTLAAVVTIVAGAAPQQTPVRDASPRLLDAGSGIIAGTVVVDDDTHAILRRATVTLSRNGVEDIRLGSTDEQGRFVFTNLPSGTYRLSASKGGFITASFGALAPGMPGTPIVLNDREQLDSLRIALMRGGVIAGRVTDRDGRGVAAYVYARQFIAVNGERRWRSATADVRANAHGEYRMYGLQPGEYLVYATASFSPQEFVAVTTTEIGWAQQPSGATPSHGQTFSIAATAFPGTADPAAAVPIALTRGQQRTDVDFTLQYARTARVTGVVLGPDGRPVPNASIARLPKRGEDIFATGIPMTRADTSGTFMLTTVPPGEYTLMARGAPAVGSSPASSGPVPVTGRGSAAPMTWWGTTDLTISGEDVLDRTIRLQPGMNISGRLAFTGSNAATPVPRVSLTLIPTTVATGPVQPNAVVQPDGTFQFEGLAPGTFRWSASISTPGWAVRSIAHEDQDLADVPFEIKPGGDVTGIVVTLSDRMAGLTGKLVDAAGRPTPQFYVFAFPVNRAYWTMNSRRIVSTRANNTGDYSLTGLPPGDYYVCALTEFETALQYDSSYLEQLVPFGLKISLAEGERQKQDLRVGG